MSPGAQRRDDTSDGEHTASQRNTGAGEEGRAAQIVAKAPQPLGERGGIDVLGDQQNNTLAHEFRT